MEATIKNNIIHFTYVEDGKKVKQSFTIDYFIKEMLNKNVIV